MRSTRSRSWGSWNQNARRLEKNEEAALDVARVHRDCNHSDSVRLLQHRDESPVFPHDRFCSRAKPDFWTSNGKPVFRGPEGRMHFKPRKVFRMIIKAVLLDLDNTLVDFVKMKRNSVHAAVQAMRKAGLKLGEKEAFEKIFAIYEKYGWEDQKAFQKLLHKTQGKEDYKILAHGILAYRKEKAGHLVLYEGVKEA